MTVRELIVALSKFPEKAEVELELYDDIDAAVTLFEEEGVVYITNNQDTEDKE